MQCRVVAHRTVLILCWLILWEWLNIRKIVTSLISYLPTYYNVVVQRFPMFLVVRTTNFVKKIFNAH